MAYEYSENILVQEAAGNLLQNELGWEVVFAYNKEKLGADGHVWPYGVSGDIAAPLF